MIPSLASSLLLFVLFTTSSDACMRVTPGTPGIPATACKTCTKALTTVSMNGAGAKAFATDDIVTTGACAVRTMTCTGTDANVEVNMGDDGIIDDGGTGTVTLTLTCNAAGTAWTFMGITFTNVECASA